MVRTSSGLRRQKMVKIRNWVWRGWLVRYAYAHPLYGPEDPCPKPPLILLHGFGAAIGHWRHNIPVLSETHTVYALDLLGFGASKKPPTNYQVDLWVEQVYDFWQTFIDTPAHLVGNSIGSLVCLAAAANRTKMVKSIVMISLPDVSLRTDAIPRWAQPVVRSIEAIFTNPLLLTPLFYILRRPRVIRRWAKLAYFNPNAVDDELVEILATPPYDKGAARILCFVYLREPPQFCPLCKSCVTLFKSAHPSNLGSSRSDGSFQFSPYFGRC